MQKSIKIVGAVPVHREVVLAFFVFCFFVLPRRRDDVIHWAVLL